MTNPMGRTYVHKRWLIIPEMEHTVFYFYLSLLIYPIAVCNFEVFWYYENATITCKSALLV